MQPDWLIPRWPVPEHVRAVCTTRAGGVSRAPYDSFNLGDHVGDDAVAVAHNRELLRRALDARPVFLHQVHGNRAVALDTDTSDGIEADACFSSQPGLACTIMVADCLPLLFTDAAGSFVAAAHAGWRGLAGGVIESLLQRLSERYGTTGAEVSVWLGPCIGPAAFEVGGEVGAAFVQHDVQAAACFQPLVTQDKWLADLPALARRRLRAQGVTQIFGNDGSTQWCTVSDPSRFFSHRRDRVSGRLAASIWLAGRRG